MVILSLGSKLTNMEAKSEAGLFSENLRAVIFTTCMYWEAVKINISSHGLVYPPGQSRAPHCKPYGRDLPERTSQTLERREKEVK